MSWNMERLTDLATAYWHSAALSAAVELDVFTALDGKGRSAAGVAETIGAAPRHTEELLCALAALGLVARQGGKFRLATGVARLLSRASPDCILDALKFNISLYALWGRLAETIKTGRPALTAHLGQSPESTRRFALGMHARARAMAPAILPALDFTGCRALLDLAAGPGTFGALLAEKYPDLTVTLFDLPPILEVAKELTARSPAAERIRFHAGDYHADRLPEAFDAVLYCGAIHQEEPDAAARLMAAARRALRPGGRVWIVDMMLEPGRTAPLFSALFSLNMALTSAGGRVYAGVEVARMLEQTGFKDVSCVSLSPGPYWLVSAANPPR